MQQKWPFIISPNNGLQSDVLRKLKRKGLKYKKIVRGLIQTIPIT